MIDTGQGVELCKQAMKENLKVSFLTEKENITGKITKVTWDDANDIISIHTDKGKHINYVAGKISEMVIIK